MGRQAGKPALSKAHHWRHHDTGHAGCAAWRRCCSSCCCLLALPGRRRSKHPAVGLERCKLWSRGVQPPGTAGPLQRVWQGGHGQPGVLGRRLLHLLWQLLVTLWLPGGWHVAQVVEGRRHERPAAGGMAALCQEISFLERGLAHRLQACPPSLQATACLNGGGGPWCTDGWPGACQGGQG